jgi:hypothetical protein
MDYLAWAIATNLKIPAQRNKASGKAAAMIYPRRVEGADVPLLYLFAALTTEAKNPDPAHTSPGRPQATELGNQLLGLFNQFYVLLISKPESAHLSGILIASANLRRQRCSCRLPRLIDSDHDNSQPHQQKGAKNTGAQNCLRIARRCWLTTARKNESLGGVGVAQANAQIGDASYLHGSSRFTILQKCHVMRSPSTAPISKAEQQT